MSTAAPYVTTSDRPLPFRRRADLVIVDQPAGGETVYAVKDPVGLRYHRLREHEFFVLERLDGETSLTDLRRAYERRFAPERVDTATLSGFVQDLYDAGLVERTTAAGADARGEGTRQWEAAERHRRSDWWERATSLLAIRFRGFDPEPLLRVVERGFGWLLSPAMLVVQLGMIVAALVVVGVRWETFVARLPTVGDFFTPTNLVLLVVVVACTKVLHEFGHALVQRRFGGECHEMGLLLLVFTPCLYCDVSDAWMLRSRWQRIAVSAAGIGLELVLAAICTLVWFATEPGLLNAFCLNLMVASTVGTVLFNGNPLLRYDGYFVLSDLVGVPNLGQRAEGELSRVVSEWCLGREVPPPEGTRGERFGLLLYAVLAKAYRWFVLVAIGWFLYESAKPFGLASFVVLLMLAVVGTSLVRSGVTAFTRLADPFWRRSVRPSRLIITTVLLGLLVAGVLFVPLPRTVRAPGLVRLADAEAIYVRVPGTLTRAAAYGDDLVAGDEVAVLVDTDLDLELAELRGERTLLEQRVANLEALRGLDGVDGNALPALERALANARATERRRARDLGDLVVTAPRGGEFIPPPPREERPDDGVTLATWTGRPLDAENVGTLLERGTLLGHVGDPAALEVMALVDEADVEFLKRDQRATIALGQRPGEVLEGRIVEIAEAVLDDIPPELATWADLPRRTNRDGRPELVGTWYRVRIAFDDPPTGVRPRARGHATVHVAPQTTARRLSRWLETILRFES